jgi:hypothetical protein
VSSYMEGLARSRRTAAHAGAREASVRVNRAVIEKGVLRNLVCTRVRQEQELGRVLARRLVREGA